LRSRLIPLSGKFKSPLYINKEDFYLHVFLNTKTFTYNPAGNITSLQRYSKLPPTNTGIIDQLTYTYPNQSNQVKAVQDAVNATTTEANDFEEANELATEYFYDANGNMIIDGNKQLLVVYNHLNLPTMVFYPQDGRFILWLYTATGTKLQKYVCSTSPKYIFDQAQNYAINNNALQSPHIQYAKRFANISTQRNAATQNLNPIELYQHLQDTISLVRSQPIPNTSTGTYQEPQYPHGFGTTPNTSQRNLLQTRLHRQHRVPVQPTRSLMKSIDFFV
jgi:hypothetical protein